MMTLSRTAMTSGSSYMVHQVILQQQWIISWERRKTVPDWSNHGTSDLQTSPFSVTCHTGTFGLTLWLELPHYSAGLLKLHFLCSAELQRFFHQQRYWTLKSPVFSFSSCSAGVNVPISLVVITKTRGGFSFSWVHVNWNCLI